MNSQFQTLRQKVRAEAQKPQKSVLSNLKKPFAALCGIAAVFGTTHLMRLHDQPGNVYSFVVTQAEFGEDWPYRNATSATISCTRTDTDRPYITVAINGSLYGFNGPSLRELPSDKAERWPDIRHGVPMGKFDQVWIDQALANCPR